MIDPQVDTRSTVDEFYPEYGTFKVIKKNSHNLELFSQSHRALGNQNYPEKEASAQHPVDNKMNGCSKLKKICK